MHAAKNPIVRSFQRGPAAFPAGFSRWISKRESIAGDFNRLPVIFFHRIGTREVAASFLGFITSCQGLSSPSWVRIVSLLRNAHSSAHPLD